MLITDIQRFSLDDGPGIRTTVFLAGCNMKCLWCHNPETITPQASAVKQIAINELIDEIQKDKRFFDRTGGGVTFSGGEPLLQYNELVDILKLCKEKNIHVAIETGGNYPFERLEKILNWTDLIFIDCKAYTEEVHTRCTGVSNENVINNIKALSKWGNKIIVRVPIIPNVNITFSELELISFFLSDKGIKKVELLPFHKWGEAKYEKYGMDYLLKNVSVPTKEYMEKCVDIVKRYGLDVKIA